MKIESAYVDQIRRFIPDFENQIDEITYQIDLFLAENDTKYKNPRNFRLKCEGDLFSETLYDAVRLDSKARFQEDDLYLPIEGPNLFVGFDYDECSFDKDI